MPAKYNKAFGLISESLGSSKRLKKKGLKEAFREAIEQIQQDPYSGTAEKGDLAGLYSYDVYYQGMNYEIAYRIATKKARLLL